MNGRQRCATVKAQGRNAPGGRGPASSDSKLREAISYHQAGRLAEAKRSYLEVLSRERNNAVALHLLGVIRFQEGDAGRAIELIGKAIALKPTYAEAHNNLGNALRDQGRLEEEVAVYLRALELEPTYAEAHNNLGNAFQVQGRLEEAVAACRRALELKPNFAQAHNNLGNALKDQGRLEEAVAVYRRALELKPDYAKAHSNLIYTMNYDAGVTLEEVFAESRDWDVRHAAPRAERIRPLHNPPNPERRLRVGYVSPDFRTHSVSYFVEPLLAGHDRDAVEVFCYAEVPCPDAVTARFQALADGWRSTVGLTDAQVAERIREDRIDVLVDLAGYTAKNRLLAFAERPAPVQVTWLGYGASTGMTEMDYRLTDTVVDPVEEAGAFFSETLVRLPHAFFCYGPPAEAPEVTPLPALANGHVTFGSFNNPSKTGPQVVEVWAQVLHEVPGSRLLMKSNVLRDESLCEKFRDQFAAHGIAGERIEFMPKIPAMSGHLAAYGRVDIAFDSFPYNGGTTSLEAAWMGVPVIVLRGDRLVSRMGASILTQLGLTDLVAETTEAYVETAADLAKDLDRLAALRRELRPRMAASPLCDAQIFAREVEAAFREMWRRWCRERASHE